MTRREQPSVRLLRAGRSADIESVRSGHSPLRDAVEGTRRKLIVESLTVNIEKEREEKSLFLNWADRLCLAPWILSRDNQLIRYGQHLVDSVSLTLHTLPIGVTEVQLTSAVHNA